MMGGGVCKQAGSGELSEIEVVLRPLITNLLVLWVFDRVTSVSMYKGDSEMF